MRKWIGAAALVALSAETMRQQRKSKILDMLNKGETRCEMCGVSIRSGYLRIGVTYCIKCANERTREEVPPDTSTCPSCNRKSCDCRLFSDDRLDENILQDLTDSIKICFGIHIPKLIVYTHKERNTPQERSRGIPIRLIPQKANRRNESDGTTTAHSHMEYSRRFQFFPPRTYLRLDRVDEICLTRNLEISHAMKILVHELFHVWLRQCKDVHDLQEEEAFCEMMAYLWLAELHALKVASDVGEHDGLLPSDLLNEISLDSVRSQLEFVEKRRDGMYGSRTIEKWIEVARRKTLQGVLENVVESDRLVGTLQRESCVIKMTTS